MEAQKKEHIRCLRNTPQRVTAAEFKKHHMIKNLSRTSFEVLLQHAQLDDIAGVPDDCHYGNRVTAPDVAVETFGAVKTERARHPQPRLQMHKRNTSDTRRTFGAYDSIMLKRLIMLTVNCTSWQWR